MSMCIAIARYLYMFLDAQRRCFGQRCILFQEGLFSDTQVPFRGFHTLRSVSLHYSYIVLITIQQ